MTKPLTGTGAMRKATNKLKPGDEGVPINSYKRLIDVPCCRSIVYRSGKKFRVIQSFWDTPSQEWVTLLRRVEDASDNVKI